MLSDTTLRLQRSLTIVRARLDQSWERERRDTLFLMGATLLAVLPHVGQLPWLTLGMFSLLFGWRLVLLLTGRSLPGRLVLWLGAIGCAAAVLAMHRTLLGREAGVSMLMLFLGLKLLEMRARRDLFVVIFLSIFILLTVFLESQGPQVAAMALMAIFVLVTAMLTMHYGSREPSVLDRLKTTGRIFAQAIPLAALLFLLFPRIDGPLWRMPGDRRAATTGLSETMSPGDISELALSQEIAFRVRFEDREPGLAQMYWRGPVLTRFDGRRWTPQPWPRGAGPRLAPTRRSASTLAYSVTLEPNRRRWLFALEAPIGLGSLARNDAWLTPDLQLLAYRPVAERLRYRLESDTGFRYALSATPLSLREFVQLPPSFNPRTMQLAAQWQLEEQDATRLVDRALRMFREQPFRYTLNPPLLGRHSVDQFLFDSRAGFCEHYAGAFVVLMRA
ncbi:MAG: DUF3488 and transglutaminase-like domain-containing protein, partial [Quisquiliibacterium sp.]